MVDALVPYFDSSGFVPRGYSFLWTPLLLWSQVVFDSIIAAFYYSMPVALWYFVRKRSDVASLWRFVLFTVFAIASGTTHVLSIWNIWQPDYWADAGTKGVTAFASVLVAVYLWPLIPRALAKPSEEQLVRMNSALQKEMAERRQSEAQLEAFMNNSSSVMFIKDLEGRYLHVNEPFDRFFGIARRHAITHTDAELFPPEQAAQFRANDAKALAAGTAIQFEETARYENGLHTSIVCKFPIIDRSGRTTALGGLVTDITQRKEAEEKIKQLNAALISRTAELEAANEALESFCYSISHDFRAPVRAIDGFRARLANELPPPLPSTATGYLDRIGSAVRRMGQLIDALLSLARISREPLHARHVDLSTIVEEIAGALERGEPGRHVKWRIQPRLGAEGDARLLRIALENLVGNAWKFTAKTAEPQIEFGGQATPGAVFFVRDNGAGFSMAYQAKLFRAFERLHTAKEFPGTGVGLATAQRIFQRHHGRIWAQAAEGRGATFFFEIGRI